MRTGGPPSFACSTTLATTQRGRSYTSTPGDRWSARISRSRRESRLSDRCVAEVVGCRAELEAGDVLRHDSNLIRLQEKDERSVVPHLALQVGVKRRALLVVKFPRRLVHLVRHLLVSEVTAPGEDLQLAVV